MHTDVYMCIAQYVCVCIHKYIAVYMHYTKNNEGMSTEQN